MFGRGAEEVLALAHAGIPFRVIPGLTSGLAGLAAAGIPATVRGLNQAIVLATGHSAEGERDPIASLDWAALARLGQPIVLLHGGAHLRRDRGPADRSRHAAAYPGSGDLSGGEPLAARSAPQPSKPSTPSCAPKNCPHRP